MKELDYTEQILEYLGCCVLCTAPACSNRTFEKWDNNHLQGLRKGVGTREGRSQCNESSLSAKPFVEAAAFNSFFLYRFLFV